MEQKKSLMDTTQEEIDTTYKVAMSNQFIYTSSRWTATEIKLFFMAVSKINPFGTQWEEGTNMLISLPMSEIRKKLNIDKTNAKRDIRSAAVGLSDKKIYKLTKNESSGISINMFDIIPMLSKVGIGECKIKNKKALKVDIEFNANLRSWFMDLKSNFFQSDLNTILFLPTMTSIRLFLFCLSAYRQENKDNGKRKVIRSLTDDSLRSILNIAGAYKQYSDLKSKVLTPSVKAVNETTSFKINFSEGITADGKRKKINIVISEEGSIGFAPPKEQPDMTNKVLSVHRVMKDKTLVDICHAKGIKDDEIKRRAMAHGYDIFREVVNLISDFSKTEFLAAFRNAKVWSAITNSEYIDNPMETKEALPEEPIPLDIG